MFFGKRKQTQLEQLFSDILDAQGSEALVARGGPGQSCKLLFASASAQERILGKRLPEQDCAEGFAKALPGLCKHCGQPGETTFEGEDQNGRPFSILCREIRWLDRLPATLFLLQDVEKARETSRRLYELAYLDPLTQVPNRQKLKEDFAVLEPAILSGEISGLVAILDLDNFKVVNDTYGHSTGDLMLRRLTEHLQADPVFAGHLYRLGGDEFAMLYADDVDRYPDLKQHYEQVLRRVLSAYSMPNIELACTVSMGVSFFPEHGEKLSELLRKADIALYKAKAAGRDRVVFFEDRYDMAKKLQDVLVNIHPILDAQGEIFGHLLVDGSPPVGENGEVVNLSGFNRSIDTLGLEDIDSEHRYFINYTPTMLSAPGRSQLTQTFIVQAHIDGPCSEDELADYRRLRRLGFSLAANSSSAHHLSKGLLDLVEYVILTPKWHEEWQLKSLIEDHPEKVFIAKEVNSRTDLNFAERMGFRLFQGQHFSETRMVTRRTKDLEPIRSNYYRLLRLTHTDDYVSFGEISRIISSDLALSYQLLRLINSATTGLRFRASSISMAVTYLGEESIKKWVGLLSLRGVTSEKPLELVRLSLIRARFGELLCPHFKVRRNPEHVFMVGILSLLHVAMGKTQEQLLAEMPLADDIRDSLLTKTGRYSSLLNFYKNYEYANWDEVNLFAQEHGIDSQVINEAYIEAVKWYNELMEEGNLVGPATRKGANRRPSQKGAPTA
ncbi:MAG: diguanylate cyclase [Clostridiales bacterium]|nr:diguanylate cyclase [Clostridiales bacterium]